LRIEVPLRWVRDRFAYLRDKLTRRKSYDPADNVTVPTVEFIGVWDTVAAYGLPIDEMTRGVSNWIWPLELPNRVLSPRVLCARHALALDDERTTFHPVLWTEEDEPQVGSQIGDQRLVQAWFVGMHSNVGGGYPDDALAFVAYYWIINEARQRGLMFKSEPVAEPDTFKTVRSGRDKDARLYDSRSGVGGYYRYGPRKVDDLCKDADNGVKITLPLIHESVFGRIDSGCNAYAPIVLPPVYATLMDNGRVLSPTENQFETPAQAAARHKAQERIWNFVWLRRIVYFITIAATFHLAAFWIFHAKNAKHEFESAIRLVSEIVRFVESFLPRSLHWWTDWYAGNPEWFAGGVAAVTVFTLAGSKLSARISGLMRIVWNSKGATDPVPRNTFHDVIFAIRTSRVYQAIIWAGRRHVVPLLSVLALSWAVLTLGSHLLVNIADSAGAFCTNTNEGTTKVNLGTVQEAPKAFDTRSICGATGLTVRRGYKYELTFEINEPWKDDAVPTDPIGYYSSSVKPPSNLVLYLGVPLRRVIFRPWYRLIARVGDKGVNEHFLTPVNVRENGQPTNKYTARFVSDRDGEIFLYVNDATLGLPWLHSWFYKNNHGTAKVSARLL
jgi:hypothetical protein